jgi:hypothetical protein
MSETLRIFRSTEPGDRAKAAEMARAAWCRLPWRARLLLALHRAWSGLGSWPLLGRWLAWAHVRLLDRVLEARHAGEGMPVGPPNVVLLGARADRLIHTIILVAGIAVILLRHLGRLLLSLGAFALLIPFLLWPPCWLELGIALDAARRDAEDDREDDPEDER